MPLERFWHSAAVPSSTCFGPNLCGYHLHLPLCAGWFALFAAPALILLAFLNEVLTAWIIGPSGASRTTLVKAMLGLWPMTKGQVRLDGATPGQWKLGSLL